MSVLGPSNLEFLPILRPTLPSSSELNPFLLRIDKTSQYSNFGPLLEEFEERLSGYYENRFNERAGCVVVSSGTSGLILAIQELDLPQPSRILIPAFTFVATALAVQAAGHIPVVCDVDRHNWCLTPSSVKAVLRNTINSPYPKAVIPVCTFGASQEVSEWSEFADHTGLKVVLDAAGAFGGQKVCENVTAVFSLHATKPLSCGEGGAVFAKCNERLSRIRKLSNFGFGLETASGGLNTKISEYTAAVGLAHLLSFKDSAVTRRNLYDELCSRITELPNNSLTYQKISTPYAPAIFCIGAQDERHRNKIEIACSKMRIQTRRWYLPLLQNQSMLKNLERPLETKNANALEATLLGIPFFVGMKTNDIDRIFSCIGNV